MTIRMISLAAAGLVLFAGAASAASAHHPAAKAPSLGGDPAKGRTVFTQQCSLCHSAKAGEEGQGPSLFGVVGRKAGSEPGFPAYTKALKTLNVTWAPTSLDKFLAAPTAMAPGTAMPIALPNPQERHNVVAYLASLKKGS